MLSSIPDYPCRHWPIPFAVWVEFARRLSIFVQFHHRPQEKRLQDVFVLFPYLRRCIVDECSPVVDFYFRTVLIRLCLSCDASFIFGITFSCSLASSSASVPWVA